MKNNKEKIICGVLAILSILILIFECHLKYKETGEIDTNKLEQAVEIATDGIEMINQSSTEIPELSEIDEQTLEVQEVEDEAFELQGEIAYEGDKARTWNLEATGNPQLTYISQVDSRWKNYPYTSTGNSSQTLGSSGCGVACATMIIDSIKGYVDIRTLADVFVRNGYRSANNGTYWSAYRAVADEFNIGYTETSNMDKMLELIRNNHYIISSCGNGLFTTGGHYIMIYGIDGDTLKIYDPYLYSGKFDTSTRRGKVTVSGNTVYCSVDNFRNYANYKQFFCYEYNPNEVETENKTTTSTVSTNDTVQSTNYQVRITANSSLRIRSGASTSYSQVGSYSKDTIVTIYAVSNNWGKTDEGWICLDYTSRDIDTLNIPNTVGITKKLTKASILYSKSNLTGKKYNYKANTTIKILKNISSTVDYVQVVQTGRKAYINSSNYTNITITGVKNTTGTYKRLATKTTLYKNSNLTGTKYNYLANTQVKIVKNISNTVDYVYIVKTGRYAYVRSNVYK